MIKFIKLKKKHLKIVLDWRTTPDITRYMKTDIDYNIEKQNEWYKQISKNSNNKYWLICYKDDPVGLVAIKGIDWQHKHCYGGYYIGKQWHRNRLSGHVPLCLLNHIFVNMGLNKHIAEIFSDNKKSLEMHRSIGYEDVGTYKEHIKKNGQWYDMVVLEFLSKNWSELQSKYLKYMIEFE